MAKKSKSKPKSTGQPPSKKRSKKDPHYPRGPVTLPLGIALAVIIAIFSYFYVSRSQSVSSLAEGKVEIKCATRIPPKGQCVPKKCFRMMQEDFLSKMEVAQLIQLVDLGMSVAGGSGPPSVLDLQSGAVSYKDKFIDVFQALKQSGLSLPKDNLRVYENVTNRIRDFVGEAAGASGLRLTSPSFFSRIRGDVPAVTPHDEYWHEHVDKQQYGSFVYTSLIYLNNHGDDYEGGEFAFVDKEGGEEVRTMVRPKAGMIIAFTSGAENLHHVLPVTNGVRYAVTTAFACDEDVEVTDFLQKAYAS